MVEEPQGQGGLDGEIRVAPLPTPPAAPAGRPGSDRFRGHPHRHIAASNEGLIVGRPSSPRGYFVLYVGWTFDCIPVVWILRRITRSNGPRRPTRSGYSCDNAPLWHESRFVAPYAVDGPARRLKATEAAVTRFRTRLEGSRDYALASRLSLRPSVEAGLRHYSGGRVPPLMFLPKPTPAGVSTYALSTRRGDVLVRRGGDLGRPQPETVRGLCRTGPAA